MSSAWLKNHNNSGKKNEPTSKRKKSRGPVQRDTKEVLAELVGTLKEKLDPKKVVATSTGEKQQSDELRPNRDRLTVGVDLGGQGSHYCILGLEGETRVPVTYLAGSSVEADTSQNTVSGLLGGMRKARNPCSSAPKESVSSAVRRQESTPLWVQGD